MKEENKDDPFESVIEISGLTSTHTINEFLDHIEKTQKLRKENHTQIQVNEGLNRKAIEVFPLLAEIPVEKYELVLIFLKRIAENEQSRQVIADADSSIETYTAHVKAIEQATGIMCLPTIAPYQLEDLEKHHGNDS